MSSVSRAQDRFVVTGTPIPSSLLVQNYGHVPKGVGAYDLNVCNVSGTKQSVVSSEIFQALSLNTPSLAPLGRQVIFAVILDGQTHSAGNILRISLSSATGLLALLDASKYHLPVGFGTAAAIGTLSAQQLLSSFSPLLTSNQVQKFEREVLEPALVLDSGSCVERTVFTAAGKGPKATTTTNGLSFRVR